MNFRGDIGVCVYIMSFAMSDPSDPVVLRVDAAGEAVRVRWWIRVWIYSEHYKKPEFFYRII